MARSSSAKQLNYSPEEREAAFLANDIVALIKRIDGREVSGRLFGELVLLLRERLECQTK